MTSTSTTVDILNTVRQSIFYIYYIIIVGGVVGHTLNILVFTQLKLFQNNRCAFYLTVESIVNLCYIAVLLTSTILQTIYANDPVGYFLVWCRMRLMLYQMFTLISFSAVCFTACDQFFSTSYRYDTRQMCTLKLAQYLTIVTGCIWFIHSIVFGLFLNIQPSLGCVISNPVFTRYSSMFFYPVLFGPLPIVIASFFSLLAFRNVRRIIRRQVPIVRRRLDQQMTAMVLMRVAFFVLFAVPYAIYRVYAINVPDPPLNTLEYTIRQLLQAIFTCWAGVNFTISFYIFAATSSRYRRQAKYVLVRKCWRKWKQWCCFNQNQVVPMNATSSVFEMELD